MNSYLFVLANLLAFGSMTLMYLCIRLVYELVEIILDTTKISEFVRENPDKFGMKLVAENREIPEIVGLRGRENEARMEFLNRINDHHKEQRKILENMER